MKSINPLKDNNQPELVLCPKCNSLAIPFFACKNEKRTISY
jgi:hypothetical protein